MEFIGTAIPLSQSGLDEATDLLSVKPADLWAVLDVETHGCGFLPNRRPLILFERHVFRQQTHGAFDGVHPGISSDTAGGYFGGANEYLRLEEASALDPHAALVSTSWGIGQIMGGNAALAGFAAVEDMVAAFVAGEDAQVRATANYLRARRLHLSLGRHDWTTFARGYNGPDFARNQYDARLRSAYGSFSRGPLPDLRVRQAQVLLMYLGVDVGAIDGVVGKRTRSGILTFRERHGLPLSDDLDDAVMAALNAAVTALT